MAGLSKKGDGPFSLLKSKHQDVSLKGSDLLSYRLAREGRVDAG